MKDFQIKELVFISIVVATILAGGYLLLPLMQILPIPAFRGIIVAPIYGAGITLVTLKIKKFGVITLFSLVIGGVLSIFFIWMSIITLLGGILTEVFCALIFKTYANQYSIAFASGFFPAIQILLTLFVITFILAWFPINLLTNPLIIFLPFLITFILGYGTSWTLLKILTKRKI
ncbi:hypothetical protein [Anaerobranca gottschalkii]|uniref:Energy-coupling factor transport system substrate-specific component n=1 Tax=Anaerobranca gottschalkii DSM 13577 TaxID=1120990 RepID=A0A1H9ZN08_9FIRM|nr:hypothetical protein [Anaerobranca gottschalkii]SES83141.1 hypothetical protein SAMN03080614_101126 [Anaerobranca gottschalkii DSM 13577]